MKNKNLALLIVFLTALLAGGVGTMMKIGLKNIPPFSFTFLRYFVASVFILPLFFREKKRAKIDLTVIKLSLILAINIILFIIGLQWTTVNVGQMICLGIPMIVAIISYFLFKEKLTSKKIIGIIIGLVGSYLLISVKFHSDLNFKMMLIGNSFIFIGSIFYAYYLVLSKKVQKKYSPVYITTIMNLVIMFVSLFLALTDLYYFKAWWTQLNFMSLVSIIYVGIFATTGAYLLNQYSIKLGSPLIASIGLYIQPLFTFIWSYSLIGEKITPNFLVAAMIIFVSALLVKE